MDEDYEGPDGRDTTIYEEVHETFRELQTRAKGFDL
jgi:hypothetical protein